MNEEKSARPHITMEAAATAFDSANNIPHHLKVERREMRSKGQH